MGEITELENNAPCFICGRPGTQECSGCLKVWSCCSAHMRLHNRGDECFPWRVDAREGVGRLMVATKDIEAGETIFQEEPVVVGPNQEGSPMCLSCYIAVDLSFSCPSCSYPMCGPACAESPVHQPECHILARGPAFNFDVDEIEAYHCILPLRLLLLSRSEPEKFSLTDHLMDHEEDRRAGEDWQITERTVVDHLVDGCGLEDNEGFTKSEVRRALGVLEVNCYEVHSFGTSGFRGCFAGASLLSHGCRANSRHIWGQDPPFTNTCIAAVDIKEGEEVVTSYQVPTTAAIRRRKILKTGWYFECGCRRCRDATELGSHHNTVVCPGCGNPSLLPVEPLNMDTRWGCQCGHGCDNQVVEEIVKELLAKAKDLARNSRYSIEKWLALEEECLRLVHPQHEATVEVARWLVPILARGPGKTTSSFPADLVDKKLSLATRHLAVLDIVDPGYSKPRAKCLYEISEVKLHLASCGWENGDLGAGDMREMVVEAREMAREAEKILQRLLGPGTGFEKMVLRASHKIVDNCNIIIEGLDKVTGVCHQDSSLLELGAEAINTAG